LIERQYKYHSSLKKENGEIKKGANKEMLKGRLEKYKNKTKSAKIKAKQSTDPQSRSDFGALPFLLQPVPD
jgi:hypothetical protein